MEMNETELNSYEQKKKFHAMLGDIAKQVKWDGEHHDKEWWKFIILGAAYGQHFVSNPFGEGFVCANKRRVRNLEMPNMSDLIMQLQVFGDEKQVKWTDPEWQAMMAEAEGRN